MRWTQAFVFALMFKNIHATCYWKKNYPSLDTTSNDYSFYDSGTCASVTSPYKLYFSYPMECTCTGSYGASGGATWANREYGEQCCKSCASPYEPIDAWACQARCSDFSSSITCSDSLKKFDGSKVCNEGSCNEATCCVPLTKCSEVTCGTGFNQLGDSTACPETGCTPAQCCATTCLDYWSNHIETFGIGQVCPNPQSPKLNNTKECFEIGHGNEPNTCDHDRIATCCVPFTKCSEITTCPSGGMYHQYKRLDDSTACPAEGCTTAQCCEMTCGEWFDDGGWCNSGVANNTQTCSARDMSKSTWVEQMQHTGACKEETCCVSQVNKCSEVACLTGSGYYNLDDSTACPETGCTAVQCCKRTCGEWSRWNSCNSGVVNNTQICSGPDMSKTWVEQMQHTGACKEETCCVSKVNKCSEVVCNADYNRLDDNTACPPEGCTPAQCCRPTCAANQFECSPPSYTYPKSNPDTIQCAGDPCSTTECCRPTCLYWHMTFGTGGFACPSSTHTGNHSKLDTNLSLAWDGFFADNPTTIHECCDFNGNCTGIQNQKNHLKNHFNQLTSIYDNKCPCP